MNTALIQALPAILAAAHTGRLLKTGEVTFETFAIRVAAGKVGFTAPVNQKELGLALRAVGAYKTGNGRHGTRYAFAGGNTLKSVIDIASANAARATSGKEH